jgi:N-acetylneuraminic acid mutarotase
VLVAGGAYQASAEIYDPATGTWTLTGSMSTGRDAHTATLLRDGRVLVTGGRRVNSLAQAEIYDSNTGSWSSAGTMSAARATHAATLLPNGGVLVTGGFDYGAGRTLATTETFDPATGSWTSAGSLSAARNLHTATLLPDGRVLVTGGSGTTNSLPLATCLAAPETSGSRGRCHLQFSFRVESIPGSCSSSNCFMLSYLHAVPDCLAEDGNRR